MLTLPPLEVFESEHFCQHLGLYLAMFSCNQIEYTSIALKKTWPEMINQIKGGRDVLFTDTKGFFLVQ